MTNAEPRLPELGNQTQCHSTGEPTLRTLYFGNVVAEPYWACPLISNDLTQFRDESGSNSARFEPVIQFRSFLNPFGSCIELRRTAHFRGLILSLSHFVASFSGAM